MSKRKVKISNKRTFLKEENNIEEAEVIIAAYGSLDKLQDIFEDISDWKVKTYGTLLERIKKVFGINIAEKYNRKVNEKLEELINLFEEFKNSFSNATIELEKVVKGEKKDFETGEEEAIALPKKEENEENNFLNKVLKDEGENNMSKIQEKWGVDFEVEKGEEGKWSPYSIKELCRMWKKLRKKKEHTPEETETMRELAFAIRAKAYAGKKWGSAKAACGIKEEYDETESLSAGKYDRVDHSHRGPKKEPGRKPRDETKSLAAGKYDRVDHSHRGPKKEPGRKPVAEKWGVDFEVEKGEEGKWSPYSIKELCRMWKKLRKKEEHTPEELETIRELVFAIRAKAYGGRKGKWGSAKDVCGIED